MAGHNCALQDLPASHPITRSGGGRSNFLKLLQPLIVVSSAHPSTKVNFPSKYHIQREISRHISDNCWYIIHPNSILKLSWDALMMVIFYSQLMITLLLYTFVHHHQQQQQSSSSPSTTAGEWNVTALVFDVLCVANILLKFFIGYQETRSKKIILNQRWIAKHYLTSDFALDLVTALPVTLIISTVAPSLASDGPTLTSTGSFLYHLAYTAKLIRFWSFCNILRTAEIVVFGRLLGLSHLKCKILLLIVKALTFIHVYICAYKLIVSNAFAMEDFKEQSLPEVYLKLFDNVTWMLFGIGKEVQMNSKIEFKVVLSIGGIIGFAFNIFIITQIFMIVGSVHASRFKYYQLMDQVDAYAQKKQIPMHVQSRLRHFFQERYRNDQFFVEKISCIFSDSLRNEILVNQGQKFMKNFQLLDGVSPNVLTRILKRCRTEYFLPNDIIIKAGTTGDQIYFLTSGTVSVTTANGKELCHLHEGEYFGELGLALKNNKRIITVTAIEFCEAYVLDYGSFNKYFSRTIMQKLLRVAEMRMKLMLSAEEVHRKDLSLRIALEASE